MTDDTARAPVQGFRLAYMVCSPDCRGADPLAYDGWEQAFPVLAELGYRGVDLQVRDPAQIDRAALRRLLSQAGLELAAVSTGHIRNDDGLTLSDMGDPERRRAAVDRLCAAVDLAAEFGAVVSIGGVRGATPVASGGLDAVREAVDELSARAASTGAKLVLEPQNRYQGGLLTTVAEAVDFIGEAGWDNVGVLADTFHMNIEERSLSAALLRAGALLWHVQLADRNRRHLGAGTLPLVDVLDVLSVLGYDGWLSMEHAQIPSSREAARRSAQAVAMAAG